MSDDPFKVTTKMSAMQTQVTACDMCQRLQLPSKQIPSVAKGGIYNRETRTCTYEPSELSSRSHHNESRYIHMIRFAGFFPTTPVQMQMMSVCFGGELTKSQGHPAPWKSTSRRMLEARPKIGALPPFPTDCLANVYIRRWIITGPREYVQHVANSIVVNMQFS